MTIDTFKAVQDYNHRLTEQCTALEEQALQSLAEGDMDTFSRHIAEIDRLQAQYKPYKSPL